MNGITSQVLTADVGTEVPTKEGSFATRSIDPGQDLVSRDAAIVPPPEVQWIYDTAPVGLACLSTDCRYVLINQRLTEICGISVADHIGRSVRDTVPQVADQVEKIVQTILRTGEPITAIEVSGQRADGSNTERVWLGGLDRPNCHLRPPRPGRQGQR